MKIFTCTTFQGRWTSACRWKNAAGLCTNPDRRCASVLEHLPGWSPAVPVHILAWTKDLAEDMVEFDASGTRVEILNDGDY
jgi:hypothetical protein